MAVVNLKSGAITNRDATPRALTNSNISQAELQEAVGTIEAGVGDQTGSTYVMCQIPSNAVINEILLYTDILDSGAATMAFDIGLYRTTADGGAVVDADLFASAVLMLTSAINGTKVAHEANDIANAEKMLWQIVPGSLTEDPKCMYDVVLTTTGDNDTAGTISLKVRYKQ
jgi:hypothetical protein